jgi:hypothetical protein
MQTNVLADVGREAVWFPGRILEEEMQQAILTVERGNETMCMPDVLIWGGDEEHRRGYLDRQRKRTVGSQNKPGGDLVDLFCIGER